MSLFILGMLACTVVLFAGWAVLGRDLGRNLDTVARDDAGEKRERIT